MHIVKSLVAAQLALAFAGLAQAAVTPEEARQLGTTLTAVGAEAGSSANGLIPAFTGGLATPPANFEKGSGLRPDPFAAEKPRLVITPANAAEHAASLTAGTQELLKRNPNFRVDVYPTHRTVTFPRQFLDNTARNAVTARTTDGGLGIENMLPGIPFPIPKTGYEAMWNHVLKYGGHIFQCEYDTYMVDAAGVASLASTGEATYSWPVFDEGKVGSLVKESEPYWRVRLFYTGPARRAGEALMIHESANALKQTRRAWQYLPGQRRVKLAPDIGYDSPNPGAGGAATYDDASVFNGALDRYEWKLLGKREMIVPYNLYRVTYAKNPKELATPKYLNPDFVRWELHRVWVVEATLRPGKRHVYARRVFYLDEDSWVALASDQYDARGQLYRSTYNNFSFSYDALAPFADGVITYDFVAGSYSIGGLVGAHYGLKYIKPLVDTEWSPDALAGRGLR